MQGFVKALLQRIFALSQLGCLTDPDAPQPVLKILLACYNASAESLQAGRNGYAVNHLPFMENEEKKQEKAEEEPPKTKE